MGSRGAARGARAHPSSWSRQRLRLGRGVPAEGADRSRRWRPVAPRRDVCPRRCSTARDGGSDVVVGSGPARSCGLTDRHRDLVGRRQVRHRRQPRPAARSGVRLRSPGADQLPRPVPSSCSRGCRGFEPDVRCTGVRGRPCRAAGAACRIRTSIGSSRQAAGDVLLRKVSRAHPQRTGPGLDAVHRQPAQHLRATSATGLPHGCNQVRSPGHRPALVQAHHRHDAREGAVPVPR